eukprot:Partr_v1_DN27006_c0_g1_i1_m28801 putative Solute carrier family 44 member
MAESTVTPPHLTLRKCTDLSWLLLFVIYWVGMGFVCWQAVTYGDPRLLVYPENSEGKLCGIDLSFTDRPYLYFVDPFNKTAPQVCVQECPTSSVISLNKTGAICKANYEPVDDTDLLMKQLDGECAKFIYSSEPVLKRCSPGNITALLEVSGQQAGAEALVDVQDSAQQIVGDFARTYYFVLGFAGIAAVIALTWIVLLRFFTAFFVWLIVGLVIVCVDGLAVFFYFAWDDAKVAVAGSVQPTEGMTRDVQTYFGMFIAACVFAGLINLVLLFMRKRIKVAIQVIREASSAVKSMPSMVVFPIMSFVLMLAVYAYWFVIELYLASGKQEPTIFGATYSVDIFRYLQWYHLFGLFWTQQFISGINQTAISGAVASWYFTRNKKELPAFAVFKSFGRVLRYHLGSIALGSLVIAVIQLIRAILFYIQRTLKGKQNKPAKALLACCSCCFACVEKVFKFINKNAYIHMASFGTPFCTAAKDAFQLLVRNAFRLIAIDMVSGFILFLSKVVVTCISGAGSYYAMKYYFEDSPLYYPSATVFVIMVAAFAISSVFMYVHGMAIDTIFLSFCTDIEMNDGTMDRPYFMSAELRQLTTAKKEQPSVAGNQVRPSSAENIVQTREAFVE